MAENGPPAIKPKASVPRRRSGVEVPRTLKWRHHLAAALIALGVRAISATWRCRFVDPTAAFERCREPVIFCLWHNRLALSMVVWEQWAKKKSRAAGLVALISASHDGGILSRALKYFDVEAIRGSSSRRGAQALIELTSWAQRGYHVAITPDGPRGPRYVIREGIVGLAQITGHPIVPVRVQIRGKITLRSWDQFQIPLPFARCEIEIGELLHVPREMTDEQREEFRRELENRMQG